MRKLSFGRRRGNVLITCTCAISVLRGDIHIMHYYFHHSWIDTTRQGLISPFKFSHMNIERHPTVLFSSSKDSYFIFDDVYKNKYACSDNCQTKMRKLETHSPIYSKRYRWENKPNLRYTRHRIYTTSILYVHCLQNCLHNALWNNDSLTHSYAATPFTSSAMHILTH